MSTQSNEIPRFTIADYQAWEGNWELWKGVAVAMTPSAFGGHGSAQGQMATAINNAINESECNASLLVEIDWIATDDTVLRPDLSVVCGPPPAKHIEQTPDLVVEVLSDRTRDRDLGFKRALFEEHSVSWYLIVDPDARTVACERLGQDKRYQAVTHDNRTLELTICQSCDLKISLGRLFG